MDGPTKEMDAFRDHYDLQATKVIGDACETVLLDPRDGLRLLGPAPAMDVLIGIPPSSSDETVKINRYLWVIDIRGIPYIIEAPVSIIGHALPKHTNLTGGGKAYLILS